MITIRFETSANRFRRIVSSSTWAEPAVDEVEIPAYLYPGKATPFDKDLHERPPEELEALGREIAELALGMRGLEALQAERRGGGSVRVCFEETTRAAGATAVPWELMHDGEAYLATDPGIAIVRTSAEAPVIDSLVTRRPLRMLVFWSQPLDQSAVDVEVEQIELARALAPHLGNEIEAVEIVHCSRARLEEALLARSYDVVYFTGHGIHLEGVGYLCLENEKRESELISATELAHKLTLQDAPPALVFLNCCLSAAADPRRTRERFLDSGRRMLRAGVPFVVATLTPVFVSTARTFVETFLRSLLKDQRFDVPRAVAAARGVVLEDRKADYEQAQTFFQFLLLSSTAEGWSHRNEERSAERAGARIFHSSLNYPQQDHNWVRRNHLLLRVEESYVRSERVVGVYGLGGLGKTVFSTQLLDQACRHFDRRVRVEKALWLDLRFEHGLVGEIVQQLCDILRELGEQQLVGQLREDPDPRPVPLARDLSRALGPDCLLCLDNCESLLDAGGAVADPGVRDLVTALVAHTGWRSLLTARERFSLAQDGRDSCPIRWFHFPELSVTERAALLRVGLENSRLDFDDLDSELRRLIFEEVAGHPYELRLFLNDADPGADLKAVIREVHQQTGEYARLGYYVARTPNEQLPVLRLLAALDEPSGVDVLKILCAFLQKERQWPVDADRVEAALVALEKRGLAVETENRYAVLPVLRSHLTRSGAPHAFEDDALRALHRDLAGLFGALGADASEQAREIHGKANELPEELVDAALVQLSSAEIDFLHRSFRHALKQDELKVIWRQFQKFVDKISGRLPPSRLTAYARAFRRRLDALAGEANRDSVNDVGIGYGVLGKAFSEIRAWSDALENYDRAIAVFREVEDSPELGVTYHQVGIVYQEQREWEKALENYHSAIEWKQETGQLHGLGSTYHNVGIVYQEQREWEKALENYHSAIEWNQKTGQLHELGSTYHHVGIVYQEQREWEKALENYHSAIEWKQKTGQLHQLGGTYHQVGIVYQKQREWEKALENYHSAIEWNQKTGQLHGLGSTYHQVGRVYEEQREWERALENYHSAIEWNQKTGQLHQLGGTYHQVGRVYQEQREWEKALENYHSASEWDQKTGHLHQLGSTYHQVGMVYEEQDQPTRAGDWFLRALESHFTTGFAHPQHVVNALTSTRRLVDRSDLGEEMESLRDRFRMLLEKYPALREFAEGLGKEESGGESGE